jgi:anti-sigma regulatory factor (Ser/Thr protein kinase)
MSPKLRRIELPCGSDAPRRAREWLGWVRAYLGPGQLENARLMLSELVTNSVQHSGLAEGEPITVCARGSQHGIRVSVCDSGEGFQPEPPALPPPHAPGHRGLWIVNELADAVTLDGAQGRVAFELRGSPDRAGAPRA